MNNVNCEFCHARPGEACTSRCPNHVVQDAVDAAFKSLEWIQKHDHRWEAGEWVVTQNETPAWAPPCYVLWLLREGSLKRVHPSFPSLLTAQTYAGELQATPSLLENHY